MKVLLDTHILLWWSANDRRLSAEARAHIANADNDVLVSAATFWELAIKQQLRRIDIDLRGLQVAIAEDGFLEQPIEVAHTLRLKTLPDLHRDPFDRLLIAQTIDIGARLLTRDEHILAYAGTDGFAPLKA